MAIQPKTNQPESKPARRANQKWGVERLASHITDKWYPVPHCGPFDSEEDAAAEAADMFHRNGGGPIKFRAVLLNRDDAPVVSRPLPPEPKKSNWRGAICIVPKGPEDYIERFAAMYPVLARWAETIVNDAGTSDADWKVIESAAKLAADLENWAIRAAHAMQDRRATRFDSLASELTAILCLPKSGGAE